MSRKNFDKIWEPKNVFLYLEKFFNFYKCKKIYLVGSRGKTDDWNDLDGKDWDVLIEHDEIIRNPNSLVHKKYHVDILYMGDKKRIERIRQHGYNGCKGGIEIFPNTPEKYKQFLIK